MQKTNIRIQKEMAELDKGISSVRFTHNTMACFGLALKI